MHEKGFPLDLTCILLIDVCFASGTKVEGILRQAADVEEVDHRVQEYEQGICLLLQMFLLFVIEELLLLSLCYFAVHMPFKLRLSLL